ncbi:MAG: vWA domain-containing protein [Hyphomicrobiaceae bacterium]
MTGEKSQRSKRPRKLLAGLSAALVLSESLGASYAWACRENAMIVFDASGSMARRDDGRSRITIARQAAADVLPSVTKTRPTGLVTYGGLAGPACSDVIVRVEPQAGSGRRIIAELDQIQPLGPTALTAGVRTAANILLQRGAAGIVVLITDGLENCGGRACELARQLQDHGDMIRVHVISFFLDSTRTNTLKCLTGATNGTYVFTNSLESLRDALRKLLGCLRISQLGRVLPWKSEGSPYSETGANSLGHRFG